MSARVLVLFLHIVGTLALFMSLGLEQACVRGLRRATTTIQAREWVHTWGRLPRIDGPAGLTVLATGIYLAVAGAIHAAWIVMGLLGMIVIGAIGAAVTRGRVQAISRSLLHQEHPLSLPRGERPYDIALLRAASLRLAIAVGIVFEMTVKPSMLGAVLGMVAALVMGGVGAIRRPDRL